MVRPLQSPVDESRVRHALVGTHTKPGKDTIAGGGRMVLILDSAGTGMGREIINMADSGAAAVLIIYYWKIVSIISLE